ncbi:PHP domain-containing protein [bacterium]|nr:PHP domain-containing protein [bacterium]
MNLKTFRADLHVHSCLSPCGEFEMTPVGIVAFALEIGLDIIAVCDHNSAANVPGIRKAALGTGLVVIAGMEVATAEEAHILALFDDIQAALALQKIVYDNLLPGENDDDLFGMQIVANELDEVEKIEQRLLIGSTMMDVDTVVREIHALGGLAIASHIDRQSNSLIGQLGMISDDLPLDAVEVSYSGDVDAMQVYPGVSRLPIIRSSDAHQLDALGRAITKFRLAEPTVVELRKALQATDGREISGWSVAS